MANTPGGTRFSVNDKAILLEVVKSILPTGANEWELVRNEYMKRQADMAREDPDEEVAVRDIKSLKSLYSRLRDAKSKTGTPYKSVLNVKAREIDDLIKLKTVEGELGTTFGDGSDEEENPSDDEAMEMEGNRFPSLEEQVVEFAAADDQQAAVPRSASRTTPTPRRARAVVDNGMSRFTDTFAHYMEAAIKTMEGPSNEESPSTTNASESRLVAMEKTLGEVKDDNVSRFAALEAKMDTQLSGLYGLLNRLVEKAEQGTSSEGNQQNKRQRTK